MTIETGRALHAGEVVVEALKAEEVDRVYCLPGSHIFQIYDALRDEPSINLVTCKLESSTSVMADMHGRLTGRPGVCLVTAGPGAANSLAGVAQAYSAASPLVHISGAVPIEAGLEAFHGVDETDFVLEMFKKVTKWSVRVERIEDIPSIMARAFKLALSGRSGPVHIEIPRETDTSPCMIQSRPAVVEPYRSEPSEVLPPSPQDVDRFARMLLEAKRPLICAGKGILRRRTTHELAKVSEMLSAPVIYPQDSIGVIPHDHPFEAGFFALWSLSPFFVQLMAKSDLLLSVGLRAGTATTTLMKKHAPRNHIFVGFDSKTDGNYSGENEIVADPKLFLIALWERLKDRARSTNVELRRELARQKQSLKEELDGLLENHRSSNPIHPGFLVETLASLIKRDAIVVSDVGNCAVWLRNYLPVHTPESHLQSGMWNAMGFSLPSAIVAKMVYPDRQVVGVTGDGAYLMTVGDFGTTLEQASNVVMVVLNDSAFSMIKKLQTKSFGRSYGWEITSPNFAEMARTYGAFGIRVEEPSQLADGLKEALSASGPAVVDIVTGDFPYPSFELSG